MPAMPFDRRQDRIVPTASRRPSDGDAASAADAAATTEEHRLGAALRRLRHEPAALEAYLRSAKTIDRPRLGIVLVRELGAAAAGAAWAGALPGVPLLP